MSRRRRRSSSLSKLVLIAAGLFVVFLLFRGCTARPSAPARSVSEEHQGQPTDAPARHRTRSREPEGKPPNAGPSESIASSPHVLLGVPRDEDPSDDQLLDEHEYVLSYNPKRHDPNWVAWRLDRSYLGHMRRRDNFHADELLPTVFYRVTPHDYARSGYDRGHLCPSADREATPEMNSVTFSMLNMLPQLHELNAGPWEKLEQHERELAERRDTEIYIAAGGVFDASPPTIGHGVAVPKATWKVIVALRTEQTAADVTDSTPVIAVIMPNETGVGEHEWRDFVTSVDEVERTTGYDLLSRVVDDVERRIEARVGRGE